MDKHEPIIKNQNQPTKSIVSARKVDKKVTGSFFNQDKTYLYLNDLNKLKYNYI
jgi:hypothetical protein